MNLIHRLWNGPYPLMGFLVVVGLGTAVITGGLVALEGWLLYFGPKPIPGATHVSEIFFTGILATFITGMILHRHASRKGECLTLPHHKRCPFLGILILGILLGGVSLVLVLLFQGTGDVSYRAMMTAKIIQGVLVGFSLPFLFHYLGLLRHPGVCYE